MCVCVCGGGLGSILSQNLFEHAHILTLCMFHVSVSGSSPSISERVTEELAGSRSSGHTSKMSTMRINDEGEDTDELADARFAV